MGGRWRRSPGAAWCCVLGAMVLLAACTGSRGSGPAGAATSASAVPSAGDAAQGCSSRSGGVSGFARSPGLATGGQLVLGRIAVQTGYLQGPVPVTGNGPWRYWEKRGILIFAGTGSVLVSVPPSWRQRAAITYGSYGIVSSLVLTACQRPAGVWDGDAGGIDRRAPASCGPPGFALAHRSLTLPLRGPRR